MDHSPLFTFSNVACEEMSRDSYASDVDSSDHYGPYTDAMPSPTMADYEDTRRSGSPDRHPHTLLPGAFQHELDVLFSSNSSDPALASEPEYSCQASSPLAPMASMEHIHPLSFDTTLHDLATTVMDAADDDTHIHSKGASGHAGAHHQLGPAHEQHGVRTLGSGASSALFTEGFHSGTRTGQQDLVEDGRFSDIDDILDHISTSAARASLTGQGSFASTVSDFSIEGTGYGSFGSFHDPSRMYSAVGYSDSDSPMADSGPELGLGRSSPEASNRTSKGTSHATDPAMTAQSSAEMQGADTHQTGAHQCEHCRKSFGRKSDLVRHRKIHSGDRAYVCNRQDCGKTFIQRSALLVHERTHTGEQPYKCGEPSCGRLFADSSSLARHRRTHNGKRPHKCTEPDCGRAFTRRGALQNHMKTHRPDWLSEATLRKLKRRKLTETDEEDFSQELAESAQALSALFGSSGNLDSLKSMFFAPDSSAAETSDEREDEPLETKVATISAEIAAAIAQAQAKLFPHASADPGRESEEDEGGVDSATIGPETSGIRGQRGQTDTSEGEASATEGGHRDRASTAVKRKR